MPENNRILLKTLRMARVNRGRKAGKMEFDSSRKAFFESHNLEAKELPLIFHKDYICRNAERGNWHPNIEFLLVLEGEGMCTVGAENLEMHPGDLIAINSNQLHIIHSNSSVVYHCLILDSDFCLQNNIPTEKLYYQTMIHSEEANRLFLGIVAELEKEQAFQIAGIKCAVLQFLLFLSRNFLEKDRSVHAVHTAEDENMKLAIGYIQSHLQEKLSLEKKGILKDLLNLTQLLKKYNLLPDEIEYDSNMEPVLYYGTIQVDVGSEENLSQKVIRLSIILPQLSGLSGTLHLETWTPETTDIIWDRAEDIPVEVPEETTETPEDAAEAPEDTAEDAAEKPEDAAEDAAEKPEDAAPAPEDAAEAVEQ